MGLVKKGQLGGLKSMHSTQTLWLQISCVKILCRKLQNVEDVLPMLSDMLMVQLLCGPLPVRPAASLAGKPRLFLLCSHKVHILSLFSWAKASSYAFQMAVWGRFVNPSFEQWHIACIPLG